MPKVRTEDRREYERNWRSANAERLKTVNRVWREAHAETLRAKKKAYYAVNAEGIKAKQRANRKPLSPEAAARRESARLERRTGFTTETLTAMLEAQGYRCAICATDLKAMRRRDWHADHCHLSELPRGVLCGPCNMALGLFKDDVGRLRNAIAYLQGTAVDQ